MEQPVRVRILDNEYLVKSDEDEELVHKIAQFVDQKFREVSDGVRGLSENRVAVLAAFHIASEYFQLLKERGDLLEDLQDRARAMNCQIDSIIK